jgi:hypothetical protein
MLCGKDMSCPLVFQPVAKSLHRLSYTGYKEGRKINKETKGGGDTRRK